MFAGLADKVSLVQRPVCLRFLPRRTSINVSSAPGEHRHGVSRGFEVDHEWRSRLGGVCRSEELFETLVVSRETSPETLAYQFRVREKSTLRRTTAMSDPLLFHAN